MGYGLMSSSLGWPWPDYGLGEGGPEQKFQGGPSPYFFFLEIFYLLKNFFLGPGGARAPLALYLGPSLVSGARPHASQVGFSRTCRWQRLAFVGRIFWQTRQVKILILFGTWRFQIFLQKLFWFVPWEVLSVAGKLWVMDSAILYLLITPYNVYLLYIYVGVISLLLCLIYIIKS